MPDVRLDGVWFLILGHPFLKRGEMMQLPQIRMQSTFIQTDLQIEDSDSANRTAASDSIHSTAASNCKYACYSGEAND